jgi:protein-S-isoprenylcysteine O-methyltransferase Ste14
MPAWPLCLPLLLGGLYVSIWQRPVAKRMADMTGYSRGERLVTMAASLLPYPFMALTVWTPFCASLPLLLLGAMVYGGGVAGFFWTLAVFQKTPASEPLLGGAYRLSRNPLYVAASLVFLGICLMTASARLFGLLAVIVLAQHFMILAEERACRARYGSVYDEYARKVSRYYRVGTR